MTNPETIEKFDYLVKIVLIGDANVGKTNILSQLVDKKFNENSKPTIGVEFGTKIFRFDGYNVKVQIWDTAGQERYHAITTAYYRGASGVVLVYDVCNEASLDHIRSIWLKNIHTVLEPSVLKVLLGNKKELEAERQVSTDTGRGLAIEERMEFFETSALSGENIEIAFETFIKKIYEAEKGKSMPANNNKTVIGTVDLKGHELGAKKKSRSSGCC